MLDSRDYSTSAGALLVENDKEKEELNVGAPRSKAKNSEGWAGLEISENSLKVLERRYLKKNEAGEIIERPEDLFKRVAKDIALADLLHDEQADVQKTEREFYNMMARLEFLPNSPTLMNAGRHLQQLSACFVLPIEDSMDSIFETLKDTALIHKSGGGTGFSFSRLRPANSPVASTSGVSSGPVSFMAVFDSATEAIKQGGTRRGANMGILRIDHPNIEEFITCKNEEGRFNNFNISVGITDKFMEALKNNEDFPLVHPATKEVMKKVPAKALFKSIVSSAWKNGEPGIIFLDRMNEKNPTPLAGEIESTNPCGEQPLLPYESCNLGSINLNKMVSGGQLDYQKLKRTVHSSVHFLDNVIDRNKYPIEKIEKVTKGNRKIGLGVMGFADMLIQLGIPYDSEAAFKMGEEVMEFINLESKKASAKLALDRGPFPNFKGSMFDKQGSPPIRNATTTTIAPTGTISIIANSSSGIEPLFAVSFVRSVMDKDRLVEAHPFFQKLAMDQGFYSDALMESIAQKGNINEFEEIPEKIRKTFVTAHFVKPQDHIKMQAAFQKHTDNAVSKTINFPNEATEKEVEDAYLMAFQTGCKGLTIYRDGSRDEQVLSTGATSDKKKKAASENGKITPRPRPAITSGYTFRIATGCGNLYLTINECEKGIPFEIFTQMGKAGGCAASQSEAIGRLVSLALRSNIQPDVIVKQLTGISCHQPTWENGCQTTSCADGIGKAIAKYLTSIKKGEKRNNVLASLQGNGKFVSLDSRGLGQMLKCPECSSAMAHEDGCLNCHSCGFSKCS
ncbi:MAG: vitamin B12-dependent ribonucleotide reductase [Nitrospinae bacterium]|nr:vitamin B12-dependent ribonucleotide reductase [Nitrospinota bacterium]